MRLVRRSSATRAWVSAARPPWAWHFRASCSRRGCSCGNCAWRGASFLSSRRPARPSSVPGRAWPARKGQLAARGVEGLHLGRCGALQQQLGKGAIATTHVQPACARRHADAVQERRAHQHGPAAHQAFVGGAIVKADRRCGHGGSSKKGAMLRAGPQGSAKRFSMGARAEPPCAHRLAPGKPQPVCGRPSLGGRGVWGGLPVRQQP